MRGIHAHEVAAERYRDLSRAALTATMAARSAAATLSGVSLGASQLFAIGVAAAAVVMATAGEITPGDLATVAGVSVLLVGRLDMLVSTLGRMWAMSQASAERVLDLLRTDDEPASTGERELPLGSRDIDLRGVVISGCELEATIPHGSFAVIRAPMQSAERLRAIFAASAQPDRGDVAISGVALRELRVSSLRDTLLVVPRSPSIFAGTVGDNIEPTSLDAERAMDALHVAALDLNDLGADLSAPMREGGTTLSGGQRQRLALARSVASDAEVLVMFDPTSSVDAVTEATIVDRLVRHRAGRTTIVVTESPAFLAVADLVVHSSKTMPPGGTTGGSDE